VKKKCIIKQIKKGVFMIITVKLFAYLRDYNENKFEYEISEGTTIKDVVLLLKLPKDDVAIIMVNGRGKDLAYELVSGDVLALFPPVGGG
jgi:molybdopterin converting factor small subunit